MSHSQFHCTGRAYLDMHGLIFETSICYWQDQPGRSARSRGWDRQGPPLAHSLARSLAQAREKPGTGAGRAPRRRGHSLRGEASRTTEPAGSGRPRTRAGQAPAAHPHTPQGRGAAEAAEGGEEIGRRGTRRLPPHRHRHTHPQQTERTPSDGGHARASPSQRGGRDRHQRVVHVVTAPRVQARPDGARPEAGRSPSRPHPAQAGTESGAGVRGGDAVATRAHQTPPKEGDSQCPSYTPPRPTGARTHATPAATPSPRRNGPEEPATTHPRDSGHTREHHHRRGATNATGGGGELGG